MKNMLTLEAFADWCEKQPVGKVYPYTDVKNCACSQYAKSLGVKVAFGSFWYKAEFIAAKHPRTFGALAGRLRAVQS